MPKLKTASTRRAKRRDKLARWVITLGGITVIASVVAILALIVGVTVPLFRTPRANVVCHLSLPNLLPLPLGEGPGVRAQAARTRRNHVSPLHASRPHPNPLPKGEGDRAATWDRHGHGRHQCHGLRLVRERNRCLGGPADGQTGRARTPASARRRREKHASSGGAAGRGKILALLVRRRGVIG